MDTVPALCYVYAVSDIYCADPLLHSVSFLFSSVGVHSSLFSTCSSVTREELYFSKNTHWPLNMTFTDFILFVPQQEGGSS